MIIDAGYEVIDKNYRIVEHILINIFTFALNKSKSTNNYVQQDFQ